MRQLLIEVLPPGSSYYCTITLREDTHNRSYMTSQERELRTLIEKNIYPADYLISYQNSRISIRHKADAMRIKLIWPP